MKFAAAIAMSLAPETKDGAPNANALPPIPRSDSALDQLTPMIYAELRRRAHGYMKNERPGHTLQTTALANEAWLRLVNVAVTDWKDRAISLRSRRT